MKRNIQQHGQHFLRGRAFIAELIGHSNIRKNDTVLDIGAGSGAIAGVLASHAKHVIAYEPESTANALLRKNMQYIDNVTILQEDFLKDELPGIPYKVFSNIPFHLSSEIVRKLTSATHPPKAVYLIVQKQFAQKLIASGDHFHGALGIAIAPWWAVRIRRPLRKTDFTPPPAVDTVLLELKPHEIPLLDVSQQAAYTDFVMECYAAPRFYATVGGDKSKRPSTLTPAEWVRLFTQYSKKRT